MFHRVVIRVADLAASQRFYEITLGAAGITDWGDFSIAAADPEHPPTRGLHIGFSVADRDRVHAFWNAGVEAGFTDDGAPGPRPQYTEDYYGGFLLDLDGNSAEAVHHRGVRRGANVDHVWVRVADVAASKRFYESVGADAGFRLDKELPGRAAFEGGGGDFSVVEGVPTANAHLAFAVESAEPGERLDPDGNTVELVRA